MQHAALVELADYVGGAEPAERGRLVRRLGVVVIEAGSVVTIRWAHEVARFLPARYR